MGLADMVNATKPREFELPSAVSVEDLCAKMQANAAEFEDSFALKKGLGGAKILFDNRKDLECQGVVTVKGTKVKVHFISKQTTTTVGVGGFSKRVDKSAGEIASIPERQGEYMDKIAAAIKKIMGA